MSKLQSIQLSDIQWFDSRQTARGVIPLLPFYHEKTGWSVFINDTRSGSPPKSFIEMKPHNASETIYFSDSPASEEDIYSHFFDFIYQRALLPGVQHEARAIFDDILNLGACLQKIEILFSYWDANRPSHRLVTSELEYMYIVCRSIFDHLQKAIKAIWANVTLTPAPVKKHVLKDSFREMLFTKDGKTHYSRDQLVAERGIFPALADYYLRQSSFFEYLRKCRDEFAHNGKSIDTIYHFPRIGFGISLTDKRFSVLDIWTDRTKKNNNIGSLNTLCGYVICNTISAIEEFAVVIQQHIGFPDPIVPNHHILLRGDSLRGMLRAVDYLNAKAWLDEVP